MKKKTVFQKDSIQKKRIVPSGKRSHITSLWKITMLPCYLFMGEIHGNF